MERGEKRIGKEREMIERKGNEVGGMKVERNGDRRFNRKLF